MKGKLRANFGLFNQPFPFPMLFLSIFPPVKFLIQLCALTIAALKMTVHSTQNSVPQLSK